MADSTDGRWMREALRLAARARGRTAPNPVVGAVVVKGGRRVAGGYHTGPGTAHAEARALAKAGRHARGATLYVTLEPCAHWGLTPPCVEAVVASGARRVVCGMRDPDARTAGRSLARMRRRGIAVTVGVEEERCRALLSGFESRVRRGRPFTELKLAATLDGRIATKTGESQWITGPEARAWVHRLRARVDAVCVGSGTALADDPALTARIEGRVRHRPRRIVVDGRLRTPVDARLLQGEGALLLTRKKAPAGRRRALEAAGAEIVPVASRGAQLDLRAAWRALGRLGVNDLLVEGGAGLAAALLRARLVDRLYLFLAPTLIGGDGRPLVDSLGVARLRDSVRAREISARKIGQDVLLVAEW